MKEFIENLISRLEELRNDKYVNGVDRFTTREKRVFDIAEEIVNQLAEEYINCSNTSSGWIPCSERLPEESGEYYTYVYYDGHYMYSIDEIDCDAIVKEWNCSSDYKIIAWKPIAPYQPKGE